MKVLVVFCCWWIKGSNTWSLVYMWGCCEGNERFGFSLCGFSSQVTFWRSKSLALFKIWAFIRDEAFFAIIFLIFSWWHFSLDDDSTFLEIKVRSFIPWPHFLRFFEDVCCRFSLSHTHLFSISGGHFFQSWHNFSGTLFWW